MNNKTFLDWFTNEFIPNVIKSHRARKENQKSIPSAGEILYEIAPNVENSKKIFSPYIELN